MGIPPLTHGWYQRFSDRYPDLVSRTSEILSQARQEPDEAVVETLHETLEKLMDKYNLTAERVFNCDETGFNPRPKVGKVLARKGSTNVWSRTMAVNFHLTFVACVSASGLVIPPLLILPGQRLPISETQGALAELPAAAVTGSSSGFVNADIFSDWLGFFASTPEALRLGCDAWISGISGTNSTAGFKTCGLFPLSKTTMLGRLELFKTGGLSFSSRPYIKPDWIQYKAPIIETVH
ncbi:hypothetical protein ACHHYP_13522 [Achlya hypogyna]|uniref:HTH CENPB-type domain-containing protein n=1 Tax=Achlya hypogyna TaxID=1202772 RepID=A0A1V9YF46_ACHHY|nr:hypothetical protein ACHHYP_13522 [Achlya hypogyna]